jgi:asparagine synthetase B (glutamine-hydrolysing)
MNTIWNYEMNIHLQRILLKMDRASMYSSLESRVPYLSNKLVEIAANTSWKDCIISNQGKDNVKKILLTIPGMNLFMLQKRF